MYAIWAYSIILLTLHSMNKPKTTNEVNQARISNVQEYISRHYREELSLSELAVVANLAPSTLCHIFKRMTGRSIFQHISAVRIQHVKEMLQNTELTIKAIAYDCGFSTLTNFNRQFKSQTGCTPTEWRSANANENNNNKYE